MINLISNESFNDFHKDFEINIKLSDLCEHGIEMEELYPDKELVQWWEQVEHSDKNWKVIQQIETERLLNHWVIEYLCMLSNMGVSVNILCKCHDSKFCFRSILYEILADKNVDVFMK